MSQTPNNEDLQILEFPCQIDVKMFFLNNETDEQIVKDLVAKCIEKPNFESWVCKDSKAGKYRSASAAICAQSREQIDYLYQSLSDHEKVIMVI